MGGRPTCCESDPSGTLCEFQVLALLVRMAESHVACQIAAFAIGGRVVAHPLPCRTGLFQHAGLSAFDVDPSCWCCGADCGTDCRTRDVVHCITRLLLRC